MPHREKALPHVGAHSQHPEVSGKAIGYKERDGSMITSNGDRHSQVIEYLQHYLSPLIALTKKFVQRYDQS